MLNKFINLSPGIKYCVIAPLVLAILYLAGILDIAYGYYTFVRILSFFVLFGVFGAFAFDKESVLNFPCIASAIVLILFNPFFPLYFEKETWIVLDIISAITMFAVSGCTFYTAPQEERQECPAPPQANIHQKGPASTEFLCDFENRIACPYMLNITDDEMKSLAVSQNPLNELKKYVSPDLPNIPLFCWNLSTMGLYIVEKLNLTESEEIVFNAFLLNTVSEMRDNVSEEDIKNIAHEYSKNLPQEMSFLENQINYELCVLGLFAQYAMDINDVNVIAKINQYRRKRNYI